MKKHGSLLVFIFSLALMAGSGIALCQSKAAFNVLSHAHQTALTSPAAVEGIVVEYTLVLVLGSLMFLIGAVVALISGISWLLPKKRDNFFDRD